MRLLKGVTPFTLLLINNRLLQPHHAQMICRFFLAFADVIINQPQPLASWKARYFLQRTADLTAGWWRWVSVQVSQHSHWYSDPSSRAVTSWRHSSALLWSGRSLAPWCCTWRLQHHLLADTWNSLGDTASTQREQFWTLHHWRPGLTVLWPSVSWCDPSALQTALI